MSARYRLMALCWILQFVNYVDRVSISVTAPSMMKDLHLDAGQFGLIFGAFSIGYTFMQLPGGMMADRFGAKAMLVGAPLIFSVFTGLTGLVSSLGALLMVRLCFGLAEGSNNSAVYKVVADNFSKKEAAKAHSVWLSALAIGPAVVAPVVVLFLTHATWRHVFYSFAIPGVFVSALIYFFLPNQRAVEPMTPAERQDRRAQWKSFLRLKSTWYLFTAYLTLDIGFWGFLAWMPTYLTLQRHIDLKALGYAASIPYVFGFLGLVFFGLLGSGVMHRRRPMLLGVAGICAAVALYFTYTANSVQTCLIGLSVSAFLIWGMLAPYAGLVAELSPDRARGGFAGLINTGGQIGALASPVLVGYIVKATGSFNGGFMMMVAAMVVSAGSFAMLQPYIGRRSATLMDARA